VQQPRIYPFYTISKKVKFYDISNWLMIFQDYKNAEKYANISIKSDRFNAKAYVNKGNIEFSKGKFDEARDLYQEALIAESDCMEALYNLGLVLKKQVLLKCTCRLFRPFLGTI
jgi:tetratricopeptide (TPR) repeat protein